jgi:hypothetical protein
MRVILGLLALGLTASLALAGCAPPMTVSPPTLTSSASLSNGKRVSTSTFTLQDRVIMLVDFTWPDPTQEGGLHSCEWKWFRGTTLVSDTPVKRIDFRSTPWTLQTGRPAAALGTGDFTVETIVDGNVVGTGRFTITG